MSKKYLIVILAAVLASFISAGCLNFLPTSITETPTPTITLIPTISKAPTSAPTITSDLAVATVSPTPTKEIASPTPTQATATTTPTPSSSTLEGEFIVVNVYNVTSISYFRAILVNSEEIVLLTCLGTPYELLYDVDTGLKTVMKFYIKDEVFITKLDNREYASKTGLQEVYLHDAKKTVYIGRTGINISLKGKMTSASQPGLKGLLIFEVSECDKAT